MTVITNPQEAALVSSLVKQLRHELHAHAIGGAEAAGFKDRGARTLAAVMCLIGAAKMVAVDAKLHVVFQAACMDFANGTVDTLDDPNSFIRSIST